jgi:integrase
MSPVRRMVPQHRRTGALLLGNLLLQRLQNIPADATRTMKHHFTHQHRQYRLFKRSAEPGASWYLYFEERGSRILRSSGHAGKAEAVKWAKTFLDARRDDNAAVLAHLLARPGVVEYSTVGKVLDWFEVSPAVAVKPATRRGYLNCARLILRKTHPAGTDVDKLSAGVWSKDLVLRWNEVITTEAAAAGTEEEASRIKRSANSMLVQAKSIFSLLTREQMLRAGLLLPDLTPFVSGAKVFRFKKCDKTDWRPPSDEVIAATLKAWRALLVAQASQPAGEPGIPARCSERGAGMLPEPAGTDADATENRNTYAAIWLALSTGMRLGEIAQARWDWLTTADGAPLLLGKADVKNRTGELRIRPIDPFWSEGLEKLKAESRKQKAEMVGAILVGHQTETGEAVFRRVAELMRAAGWRTTKAIHALRALSGSWVASKFGVFEAQQWLRHASVMTTEKSYTVLLRDKTFKPMPIEWAKAQNLPVTH